MTETNVVVAAGDKDAVAATDNNSNNSSSEPPSSSSQTDNAQNSPTPNLDRILNRLRERARTATPEERSRGRNPGSGTAVVLIQVGGSRGIDVQLQEANDLNIEEIGEVSARQAAEMIADALLPGLRGLRLRAPSPPPWERINDDWGQHERKPKAQNISASQSQKFDKQQKKLQARQQQGRRK